MLDFPSSPTNGQTFAPANVRGVWEYNSTTTRWKMLNGLVPVQNYVNFSGTQIIAPLPMGFSSFQLKVSGFNVAGGTAYGLAIRVSTNNGSSFDSVATNYVNGSMFATATAPPAGFGFEAVAGWSAWILTGNAGISPGDTAKSSTIDMWIDPGASTPAAVHGSMLVRHAFHTPATGAFRAGLAAGYYGVRGRITDLLVFAGSGGITFTIDSFDLLGVAE
jgi:hypothetical protein